jgi:phenylalanyl-tRNA synthetase beta chain
MELAALESKFSALPKYPSSYRDISIIIDEGISSDEIISIVKQEPSVKSVKVFDQFKGKNIPQGKKSLAFSIEYQRSDRTLTDEEVNSAHSAITQALQQKLSIQLR